jgi:hypothetical protein
VADGGRVWTGRGYIAHFLLRREKVSHIGRVDLVSPTSGRQPQACEPVPRPCKPVPRPCEPVQFFNLMSMFPTCFLTLRASSLLAPLFLPVTSSLVSECSQIIDLWGGSLLCMAGTSPHALISYYIHPKFTVHPGPAFVCKHVT